MPWHSTPVPAPNGPSCTEHVHTLEDGSEVRWTEHEAVSVKEGREMAALEQDAAPLFSRTAGLWGAAILTLCIFSFLLGDNPLYKAAEAIGGRPRRRTGW